VPVVSLQLVDPRFYHLDVALAPIDDANVVYYPGAFSEAARSVLAQLFPAAILATEEDALAFGLNLVSDGRNVVLNSEATALAARLREAGYTPVPVELSELKKGGGRWRPRHPYAFQTHFFKRSATAMSAVGPVRDSRACGVRL